MMWYDYGKIFSYKKFLNIILGERGVGKTYGAKKFVLRQFLFKNKESVWVRRTQEEIDRTCKTWLNDIGQEFTEYKFSMIDYVLYLVQENEKTKTKMLTPIVYFIALSAQEKYKSTSFPNVDFMFFDEFLAKKSYLKDEFFHFCELIETVFRQRSGRIVLSANALSTANPYFSSFNIKLNENQRFTVGENYIVELCNNEDYRKFKRETMVGKLLAGTTYSTYSIDNEFILDNTDNVVGMYYNGNRFMYNLVLNSLEIGVYNCNGKIYFSLPNDLGRFYTIYFEDCINNSIEILNKNDKRINFLFKQVINSNCLYKDLMIKNEIMLMCRRLTKNF